MPENLNKRKTIIYIDKQKIYWKKYSVKFRGVSDNNCQSRKKSLAEVLEAENCKHNNSLKAEKW